MIENMKVEFGRTSDIDSWMRLVRKVSWNFPGLETEQSIDEHKIIVLKFMNDKRALCVKNEQDIVGILLYSRKHNMICCLAVDPAYRKRGIASILLREALNKLDRDKNITVSTFRENDVKGIAPRKLYKKFGFEEGKLIEEFGYPNQRFVLHATPLENARLKAMAYYEAFQIPVFSCDSGLYFDNVPDEVQPGVHVRNVNGKCLSDDEMIDYYSGLVKAYGNLVARYRNAICFVMDNTHIYEAMELSMESEKFILTDKPHSTVRKEGFPLDSISLDIKTNKYYYDLPEDKLEQVAVEDGFLEFFKNILNLN